MIKVENIDVYGFEAAIRGMRNPMNSWNKGDSYYTDHGVNVGPNDFDLMTRLAKAGTEHRKYLRMITVYADITAPLYWWKEYDTYKVGTVANSTSTMHKLLHKPFEVSDFSFDKLDADVCEDIAEPLVYTLNELRDIYFDEDDADKKKKIWYSIVQLLPSSYNQKRTVMLNYETVLNIIRQREHHKLDEWVQFVDILKELQCVKGLINV